MNPGVECFLLWSISMSVPKRQLVSSHVTTIAWNCLKPVFPHKENRLSFQAMARRHAAFLVDRPEMRDQLSVPPLAIAPHDD